MASAEDRPREVRRTIARALGVREADLPTDVPVVELGLASLPAIGLIDRLERRFGVRLDVAELLGEATVADVIRLLDGPSSSNGNGTAIDAPGEVVAAGADAEAPLRPSHGQEALWFEHRRAPASPAYNLTVALRLRGHLDVDALRRSLQTLVDRHDALRARVAPHDAMPALVVTPRAELPFAREPLVGALEARIAEVAARPFDLSVAPLLRATLLEADRREHILVLVGHHIAIDLWSFGVLLRELGEIYTAACAGLAFPLTAAPRLADYLRAYRERVEGPLGETQLTYWMDHLASAPPTLDLPTDRPRPARRTGRAGQVRFRLGRALTGRLKHLARQEGATPFATLLAAFQVLLFRYSGQKDLVVAAPAAGRLRADFPNLVGYLVNPLPLRARLAPHLSFRDYLATVRSGVLGALAHQDYPFSRLVERVRPERDSSRTPFYQVTLAYQEIEGTWPGPTGALAIGASGVSWRLGDLTVESVPVPATGARTDLALEMADHEGALLGSLRYDADLFDRATARRLITHLRALLDAVTANPDARLCDLALVGPAERARLLAWSRGPEVDLGPAGWVHDEVARRAAETPEAVAVQAEDGAWSYAELDGRANRLAHHLRARGVGRDVLVGVCMERSIELVVALLAVLKSGGAYVPLDPEYPPDRLRHTAEDAGARVLLTLARHGSLFAESRLEGVEVLRVDADWSVAAAHPPTAPVVEIAGNDLAFVPYTSGSTGLPKGAMNTHAGLRNLILWGRTAYGLKPDDRILQATPLAFDAATREIFWALATGARLVLARPGGHRDPAYLAAIIQRERITCAYSVPSMLRLLVEELEAPSPLRLVVSGGEELTADLQARFFERLILSGTALYQSYGPAETSIGVSVWRCRPGDRGPKVPLGRPIANAELYVLDEAMEPAPIGVVGELYVGGVPVGRGYWRRPDLTAERYVASPFAPGASLYRTGDLARWRADGTLEFRGRIDQQIKLRGNRIELGEVEATLGHHPAVREAAVVVDDGRLAAFLTPANGTAPDPASLRAHARRWLPEVMVPGTYTLLPELPRTPSGKIDRRALVVPPPATAARSDRWEPADRGERLVAEAWTALLGTEPSAADESFFDAGGHSLLALRLLARIEQRGGGRLSVADLMRAPTAEGIARALRAESPGEEAALLPVRVGGDLTPLFVATAGYGDLIALRELSTHLAAARPLHLLLPPRAVRSVPYLGAWYARAIRSVQAEGPYAVAGISLGGLAAYEAARALAADGATVAFVGLLDTFFPVLGRQFAVAHRLLQRDVGRRLARAVAGERGEAIVADEGLRAQVTAAADYRPPPYDGPVTLFVAREVSARFTYSVERWRAVAPRLDVAIADGRHDTMLRPPHLATLAARIEARLPGPGSLADRSPADAAPPGGARR